MTNEGIQMPQQQIGIPRPYRSHRIRACDACRKRKSRCTIDLPGQSCLLCRLQGVECQYLLEASVATKSSRRSISVGVGSVNTPRPKRTRRVSPSLSPRIPTEISDLASMQDRDEGLKQQEKSFEEPVAQSAHVVGPIAAHDAQVLEQYMAAKIASDSPAVTSPYNVFSNDPDKPVLYTKVSRWRNGSRVNGKPGLQQKEILEQVIGPFTRTLVKIYFERINPAFPIFQEQQFDEDQDSNSVSAATLCQIWATSLIYWRSSNKLSMYPRPNPAYAWNQAVVALNEDFAAPGLSTLLAALLDLNGRPIYSITGNTINIGRTVALAQSLGLNRDPTLWQLTKEEKDLRIRVWWSILIHDRWGSFAHGIPPHINDKQYDVPFPELKHLMGEGEISREQTDSGTSFLALCSLTEILGRVLPLIYDLSPDPEHQVRRTLRRLESDLDEWEDSRPYCLVMDQTNQIGTKCSISGSSNLHLGFLSVKLLHSRIALHKITHSSDTELVRTRNYQQMQCRKSAEAIVDFVVNLHSKNLQEFWLPYTAYNLTSTATLLLTCALTTTDDTIAHSCVLNVRRLIERLQRAKDEDDWDLADMCLSHCSGMLVRMSGNSSWNSRDVVGQQSTQDTEDESLQMQCHEENASTSRLINDTADMLGQFQTSLHGDPTVDLWEMFNFDGNDWQ